jgi:hypothetical protein
MSTTPTPKTNEALDAILREKGELCEDTAPAVLVKTCRQLERENAAMREAIREAHAALSRVTAEAKAREGLQCGCPSMVTMYLRAEIVEESRAALDKLQPFTTP